MIHIFAYNHFNIMLYIVPHMKNSKKMGKAMKRPIGRPMKYRKILQRLENDDLYTPAAIARFAVEAGLVKESRNEPKKLVLQRIRIAMGRFSNNHDFPDEGDGMVTLRGQAPTPGWFGWRWKAPLLEE